MVYFFVSIIYASIAVNVENAAIVFLVFLSAERFFKRNVVLKALLWWESPKERVSFEVTGADGKIILKLVSNKLGWWCVDWGFCDRWLKFSTLFIV